MHGGDRREAARTCDADAKFRTSSPFISMEKTGTLYSVVDVVCMYAICSHLQHSTVRVLLATSAGFKFALKPGLTHEGSAAMAITSVVTA